MIRIHPRERYTPIIYPNGNKSKYYLISNHGNVKTIHGKQIKISLVNRREHGPRRTISLSERGIARESKTNSGRWGHTYFVSKLMWCSFEYIPPPGYEVHHKDGISTNDFLWNLECLSKLDHTIETSNQYKDSIFTEDQLREIVQIMSTDGWTVETIRNNVSFDISDAGICKIHKIYKRKHYFNAWFNCDIKPITKLKTHHFTESEIHEICEIMSKPEWSYKEIYDHFGLEYSDDYWTTKIYDTMRSIYRRKNHKHISQNYSFGKRIK